MTAANQPHKETPLVKNAEPSVSEHYLEEPYTEKSDEQIRLEMKDLVKRHSKLLHRLAKL